MKLTRPRMDKNEEIYDEFHITKPILLLDFIGDRQVWKGSNLQQ